MKVSPARQVVLAVLALVLLALQARLWFGEGSLRHVASLERQVEVLNEKNAELAERNRLLAADVRDLKEGTEAVEEIARKDLGMIRDGCLLYTSPSPRDGLLSRMPSSA